MIRPKFSPLLGLTILLFSVFWQGCSPKQSATATQTTNQPAGSNDFINDLSEYVYTKDDAFKYDLVDEIKGEGYTTYVFKMISQKWLTEAEVERPIWWHWMTMVVPDGAAFNTGMLFINGGSHKTKQPSSPDKQMLQIAMGTQSVVTQLHNVPNQPSVFIGDDYGPRVEDELIAYTWRKYLEGGAVDADNEWLARFPMTKAAVRAMDVISDFTEKRAELKKVEKFVVAGASKRGWTTWTTGAVDKRVVAIAPIVIDMLNMIPSFEHHWRAYGRWADAIHDYKVEGVMDWQNSEEYKRLTEKTEPFSFIDQLTMPKMILSASGDQFFLPDSWQFYWNELKGEKHLRYVPNSEHSMKGTDIVYTLAAFYQMILMDHARPEFDWKVKNGKIIIETDADTPPLAMQVWQANNPNARNFQVGEIGRSYTAEDIPLAANGKYTIEVPAPDKGWTAFYVELTYPGILDEVPLKLSTGIVVTPDVYPFPPYESETPKGTIK
ncbi:PhoPQ-activated pathogenicity-related family protein [Membranihabitans marinus]|uniref:PhoPQ-activated pathogenicity-related family protein n=1 Tax=Membranihabitans marinus TaxID=1227546 RepID=UPI001F3B718A|nr:PhoPQ-activated pathogenicity-related family protein [Membranihabitans marinus]